MQSGDDDEDGSLFGSPPPSPGRGRSSSPLALPSGGQNSAQNVGTLALPGSHLCSELPPVPPLASDVTTSKSASHHRPATAGAPVATPQQLHPERSSTAPPKLSAGVTRPSHPPRKTSRKTARSTASGSATPRPTPPPIPLPDPSEPPPAHFLRNQQALLGAAGLIGGVNPANLSLPRHTRGSTPSNPIVVEDERDAPTIGRRPPQSRGGSVPPGSQNHLPVPTTTEILNTLVKQKNIFPVVDALMRLIANSSIDYASQHPPSYAGYSYPYGYYAPYPPAPTGFERTAPVPTPPRASTPDDARRASTAPPPLKRRKLSSVPAGAADWDVPYPFAPGHGPADYRTNWERERGKQLIEDLVGLVKTAAQKAAAKKSVKATTPVQAPDWGANRSYYRPETFRYGLEDAATGGQGEGSLPSVPSPRDSATADNAAAGSLPAPIESTASAPSNTSLDTQPDSSIFPPAPAQDAATNTATTSQPNSTFNATSNLQPDLDKFLASIFDDIPQGDLNELFSAPDFISLNMDLSNLSNGSTASSKDAGTEQSEHNVAAPTADSRSTAPAVTEAQTQDRSDAMAALYASDPSLMSIDPALLALSMPPTASSSSQAPESQPPQLSVETAGAGPSSGAGGAPGSGAPPTPTLVGSPLSSSDQGPLTPNWEYSFPEPEVEGGDVLNGGRESGIGPGIGGGEGGIAEEKGKGKGKMTDKEYEEAMVDVRRAGTGLEAGAGDHLGVSRPSPSPSPTEARAVQDDFRPVVPPPAVLSEAATSRPAMFRPQYTPFEAPYHIAPPSQFQFAGGPPPTIVPVPMPSPHPVPPKARRAASASAKDREDILRRARAMRAQLAGEIERAKVELWETAMEGGCLVVLGKEKGVEGVGTGAATGA